MTRDNGERHKRGRNDDSPYASGQRKTLSPPKINPPPMDKKSTYKKKREYNEEPPPQRYTVTEQNDDVRADGILGGRLLRIELWNMK